MEKKITLGHSPDADDAFMFYGLAQGAVSTPGFVFEHILQDIQTLNERVRREELDVSAISFHAYPYVAEKYALLGCGASMGDGYGPVLVSKRPLKTPDLSGLRVAIPGKLTSAYLALQLFLNDELNGGQPEWVETPFDRILEDVADGRVDAGLVIHEGQLTYGAQGFHRVVDLGEWWCGRTGLPLPLGGNVIRKKLPADDRRKIAGFLSTSISHGLEHIDGIVPKLSRYARGLNESQTKRFVSMYVNDYTVDLGGNGKRAVREFLGRGVSLGVVPAFGELEWV
ncbi:MAG: ABC transporter substrate-binding protein [Verrucomicrobiae bacterium]|nr:ABC transporter substrate-binding protein [Verrucomicrobiae bacterium]